MKTELKIAWRYLFAKKQYNAIHIISGISAAAIGVVTAAMVCVMSVMNGFGTMIEQMFSQFDPDLRIEATTGKSFFATNEQITALYTLNAVEMVSQTIEETALLQFEGKQMPVRLYGVDSVFSSLTHIEDIITDGQYEVYDGAFDRAVIGRGLAWQMGIGARFVNPIQLYAPKRTARVNMLRPDQAFNDEMCFVAGTFAVQQAKYDDEVVIVDIDLTRRLLEYESAEVSALLVKISPDASVRQTKKEIQQCLGEGFAVLDRYEQQADFFRILRVEKLLTTLLLIFILLIASFNIIGSLSMLIIDKQSDIRTLSHMGANQQMIRRIFLLEGWMISALGAMVGLLIGVIICLVQQHWGILKLGNGTEYIVSAYPVSVQAIDIVLVAGVVLLLGFIAAWVPARSIKATPVYLLPLLLLFSACQSNNAPKPLVEPIDSIYTIADIQWHKQYYPLLEQQVFSIDLLSEGLSFDSANHIVGTGYNLYLSDIFLPLTDTLLQAGTYRMDTTAASYTFLPYMDFEGAITGTYLLDIQESKIHRIIGFTAGEMQLEWLSDEDIRVECWLYTADSTRYHATYQGAFTND